MAQRAVEERFIAMSLNGELAPEGATRRAIVKLWQAFEWEYEIHERRVMGALFGQPDPFGPIARIRLARQRLIWDLATAEFGPPFPNRP